MLESDWQEVDRRIQALGRQQQINRQVARRLKQRDAKRRLRTGVLIALWCLGILGSFLWLASVVYTAYR
jgi:ferric-dicitrate binding protein FerR (iron transport regulator)